MKFGPCPNYPMVHDPDTRLDAADFFNKSHPIPLFITAPVAHDFCSYCPLIPSIFGFSLSHQQKSRLDPTHRTVFRPHRICQPELKASLRFCIPKQTEIELKQRFPKITQDRKESSLPFKNTGTEICKPRKHSSVSDF